MFALLIGAALAAGAGAGEEFIIWRVGGWEAPPPGKPADSCDRRAGCPRSRVGQQIDMCKRNSPSHQTARLSAERHASPDQGVCVMELASMLAGERYGVPPASTTRPAPVTEARRVASVSVPRHRGEGSNVEGGELPILRVGRRRGRRLESGSRHA